jgi:hypothetical protein
MFTQLSVVSFAIAPERSPRFVNSVSLSKTSDPVGSRPCRHSSVARSRLDRAPGDPSRPLLEEPADPFRSVVLPDR